MSILIMNMEMPKEKKVTLTIFPDGRVYENHGERLWGHGKDCIPWKAVPVSPHGRLIDADALYEVVKKRTRNWAGGWSDVECVLTGNDIKKASTIIPAEGGDVNGEV